MTAGGSCVVSFSPWPEDSTPEQRSHERATQRVAELERQVAKLEAELRQAKRRLESI